MRRFKGLTWAPEARFFESRIEREHCRCKQNFRPARDSPVSRVVSVQRRWHLRVFPLTAKQPCVGCSSHRQQLGGTHHVMVAVLFSANVPTMFRQLSPVRLMIHVPCMVENVIWVRVNPFTVPDSVLLPGTGTGLGIGVGLEEPFIWP